MTDTTTPIQVSTREDAVRLCDRLQEILVRLTDLLNQEADLLRNGRQRNVVDLQEDKLALTRVFLQHFRALKGNAGFIGTHAPSQVDRVRRTLRAFGQTVQHNLDAVEAAKAVSQGLVQAIFDVAKKVNDGPTVYGNPTAQAPLANARPTALAYDRSL